MLSLGIIGYYIAKIYEEVKRRPRYIISSIVRGKEDAYQEGKHDQNSLRNYLQMMWCGTFFLVGVPQW